MGKMTYSSNVKDIVNTASHEELTSHQKSQQANPLVIGSKHNPKRRMIALAQPLMHSIQIGETQELLQHSSSPTQFSKFIKTYVSHKHKTSNQVLAAPLKNHYSQFKTNRKTPRHMNISNQTKNTTTYLVHITNNKGK